MATPVKITELTSLTAATGDDLFVIVDGISANTPVTKKISVAGVFGNVQANAVFKNPVTFSNTVSFSGSPTFSGDVAVGNNITVGRNISVVGNVVMVSASNANTSLLVGSNLAVNTSGIFLGNSTINAFTNSTAVFLGNNNSFARLGRFNLQLAVGNNTTSLTNDLMVIAGRTGSTNASLATVNSSVITVERLLTNVSSGVTTSAETIGLYTSLTTNAYFSVSNTTSNATITVGDIAIGNTTVNATHSANGFFAGANVAVSLSTISVGNSTVNVAANSSSFYLNGNVAIYTGSATTRTDVRAQVGSSGANGSTYLSTAGKMYIKVNIAGADTDWQKVTTTAAD